MCAATCTAWATSMHNTFHWYYFLEVLFLNTIFVMTI
jgi:hypothetical protein